jgi:hypothetical protein
MQNNHSTNLIWINIPRMFRLLFVKRWQAIGAIERIERRPCAQPMVSTDWL